MINERLGLMREELISIIIPVYNVEKYLRECLDSVLAQTYQNWEAICVNDGSPDNSGAILDEYAKKDKRFVVIHKENEGTAIARATAINNSKGEWIAYLDADDYVSEKYLETLYNRSQTKNADVVYCYYTEVKGDFFQNRKKKIKKTNIKNIGKIYLITGPMKIIKKEIFNKVIFPNRCCFGEDSSISMQIALQYPKVEILSEYLYFYRRHENSTVLKKSSIYNKLTQLLRGFEAVENFVLN